jgi:predicted phage terminase large subunit-like protein
VPLPDLEDSRGSVDTAGDGNKRSSDTALLVVGAHGLDRFLTDARAEPMEFARLLDEFDDMTASHPEVSVWYVENKSTGPALRSVRGERVTIECVEPLGSKDFRMEQCIPQFDSGHIHLPHPDLAPWVMELIAQMAGESKKSDLRDVVSQVLLKMREPEFAYA